MELEESTFLTSDNTTKLQSSRQHGTGTKTEIQTNGTRQARKTHTPMGTLGKSIYGAKTASSISGAGKTGQNEIRTLPDVIHKDTLKMD